MAQNSTTSLIQRCLIQGKLNKFKSTSSQVKFKAQTAFSQRPQVSNTSFYRAAFTSTSAIFILLFVLITLSSLYYGL
jgi:hypothetical protein